MCVCVCVSLNFADSDSCNICICKGTLWWAISGLLFPQCFSVKNISVHQCFPCFFTLQSSLCPRLVFFNHSYHFQLLLTPPCMQISHLWLPRLTQVLSVQTKKTQASIHVRIVWGNTLRVLRVIVVQYDRFLLRYICRRVNWKTWFTFLTIIFMRQLNTSLPLRFFLRALSVVYRGQGLFFSFFCL